MPELVRLYIRHVIVGFVLGTVFTGLLLWLDVAGLGHLVAATREGPLAVVMLVVFNTIVFAGVQFAIAVMSMAEPEDKGQGGGGVPVLAAAPATTAAQGSGGNRSDRAGVNFPRA
jgi:hypothetical protein